MKDAGPASARRRGAFLLLVLASLLLHGLLADRFSVWREKAVQEAAAPPRLQAVFVRELLPSAPPATPAAPAAPAPRRATARPPTEAASAPEPLPPVETAASEAQPTAPGEPALPVVAELPPAAAASSPDLAAAGAAETTPVATTPAASAPAFEWPASTRLSYSLGGYVRGEVHGSARVEWLRDGSRYQVHLDVVVGPSAAPLMQRRMSSDGELTPQGLAPRRYDEETQLAFGRPRRVALGFDADGVTLASGQRVPGLPAVQDTASQFVQLSYLFGIGAHKLQPGARIEVPLALARRVDVWVYDVVGEEELSTPFGRLPTWHLRPQRQGDASALSIETWFAPSLQYLPVRIVIRQGPDQYIDLMIERLPQQAASPR